MQQGGYLACKDILKVCMIRSKTLNVPKKHVHLKDHKKRMHLGNKNKQCLFCPYTPFSVQEMDLHVKRIHEV
jgi:hypothetical protein